MARPSKYKPEYAEQAYKLCLLGATDKDLANFFDTTEQTINAWKQKQPEFLEALKAGKDEADSKVAESLFHRARGYSHPEDKIFNHQGQAMVVPTTKHYPPDSTAAIFWLKNRQPAQWRDVRHQESVTYEATPEDRQWAVHYGLSVTEYLKRKADNTLPKAPPIPDPEHIH